MMAGKVQAANHLLKHHAPELVLQDNKAPAPRPDLDVYFYINCMQFIEMIRRACLSSLSSRALPLSLFA
jgi:hypothetical protein